MLRSPHLTTELDTQFFDLLKRASAETEVPECMREAVVSLLSGSMDLFMVNETMNPANPSRLQNWDFDGMWREIADALHMLAPTDTEQASLLQGSTFLREARRSFWESDAEDHINRARYLLNHPPTPRPRVLGPPVPDLHCGHNTIPGPTTP